ncbi:MAG: DUF4416 family protein [Candidatus Scalindua sp. AMX11]|nr:MAG: DUF4416 family protein [Candidatus Scalindua sp.]NOG83701.1 DUF4416 family protein [Planctomycetota bacterium]RZV73849.1 MAG: DUF4416 family protein [Candidatus Scalindua sp. SCAELEC01]TDE64857.1 MAG: DUF4416 family protein [Candidatus Scalindua sp. AMX11]GJQ60652.1 MAG: hypothetical protein SCALA701_34530 [Candidatus Scalindua sp.]
MSQITLPQPVKLIVGMLSNVKALFQEVPALLEERLGKIETRSDIIPFDFTDYYQEDMGPHLLRMFYSFKNIIDPVELAAIKVWTNELENKFKQNGKYPIRRPINLDPGYLTQCQLILASTKDFFHRIYLQKGIYAEVTLYYKFGQYENLPWTYPDYQTEEYKNFFLTVRANHAKDISHH